MLKLFKKNEVVEVAQEDVNQKLEKVIQAEAERKDQAISFLKRSAKFIGSASKYIWGVDENDELEVGNVVLVKGEFLLEDKKPLIKQEGEVFWNAVKSVTEATNWLSKEVEKVASERQAIAEQINNTNIAIEETEKVILVKPIAKEQQDLDLERLDTVLA